LASTFQFPEVNVTDAGLTVPSVRSLELSPNVTFADGEENAFPSGSGPYIPARHNNRANLGFVDGHAASVKKADNLAALKLKGWIDADTTAFTNARGALGSADLTQETAKGGAKDATTDRNHDANDLYDHLATIQNAADLQWPAEDPDNGGMRGEFRLDTFPPRGGTTPPAAPAKTPAP